MWYTVQKWYHSKGQYAIEIVLTMCSMGQKNAVITLAQQRLYSVVQYRKSMIVRGTVRSRDSTHSVHYGTEQSSAKFEAAEIVPTV